MILRKISYFKKIFFQIIKRGFYKKKLKATSVLFTDILTGDMRPPKSSEVSCPKIYDQVFMFNKSTKT